MWNSLLEQDKSGIVHSTAVRVCNVTRLNHIWINTLWIKLKNRFQRFWSIQSQSTKLKTRWWQTRCPEKQSTRCNWSGKVIPQLLFNQLVEERTEFNSEFYFSDKSKLYYHYKWNEFQKCRRIVQHPLDIWYLILKCCEISLACPYPFLTSFSEHRKGTLPNPSLFYHIQVTQLRLSWNIFRVDKDSTYRVKRAINNYNRICRSLHLFHRQC